MALTVRDIMETDVPVSVTGDSVEAVLKVMRAHDLPGVPVVNEGGRCIGIITEADLIMAGEDEDLHLPHYFELFGGFVFLESMSHFEERLKQGVRLDRGADDDRGPGDDRGRAPVEEAARMIASKKHNRLPVIEHGRLVGVVTRVDVLDALTAEA